MNFVITITLCLEIVLSHKAVVRRGAAFNYDYKDWEETTRDMIYDIQEVTERTNLTTHIQASPITTHAETSATITNTETSHTTPADTGATITVETSATTHVEASATTHVETSATTHVGTSATTHVEASATTHVEASATTNVEASVTTHVETSATTPVETSPISLTHMASPPEVDGTTPIITSETPAITELTEMVTTDTVNESNLTTTAASTNRPKELNPVMFDLKQELYKHHGGYLTASVIVLLDIISKKQPQDINRLASQMHAELAGMRNAQTLDSLGDYVPDLLVAVAEMVASIDGTSLQDQAQYGRYFMEHRREIFLADTNALIDVINNVYNDEDLANIADVLHDVKRYPTADITAKEIANKTIEAFALKPLRRIEGSKTEMLLKEEIKNFAETRMKDILSQGRRQHQIVEQTKKDDSGRRIQIYISQDTTPSVITLPDIHSVYLKNAKLRKRMKTKMISYKMKMKSARQKEFKQKTKRGPTSTARTTTTTTKRPPMHKSKYYMRKYVKKNLYRMKTTTIKTTRFRWRFYGRRYNSASCGNLNSSSSECSSFDEYGSSNETSDSRSENSETTDKRDKNPIHVDIESIANNKTSVNLLKRIESKNNFNKSSEDLGRSAIRKMVRYNIDSDISTEISRENMDYDNTGMQPINYYTSNYKNSFNGRYKKRHTKTKNIKISNVKNRNIIYNQIPNIIYNNDYKRVTSRKKSEYTPDQIESPINTNINEYLSNFRHKASNRISKDVNNVEASVKTEEEILKVNLKDALIHNNEMPAVRRFIKDGIGKLTLHQQGSYSDDEAILKSNIYKAFGYNI